MIITIISKVQVLNYLSEEYSFKILLMILCPNIYNSLKELLILMIYHLMLIEN